ncbi:MAG: DUF4330 domain-containing protein [Heliobacteriaceae bacterium]|jgi:hypothetical protein|nr:DUF4330 domain-containing protein [Heliobacteriaceae bacterium]
MKKKADLIIIAGLILALAAGFFTHKNFRQTAGKQIEATSKITFQIYIRGLTYTGKDLPIKAGGKTFISIRNVPYTNLDVVDVKAERRKMLLPVLNKPVEDISQAYLYDVLVTLTDNAKITKDGAVVGGNKIKTGLPVTLEGKDYKFSGIVSDLKIMTTDDKELNRTINAVNDVQ